jgi:3-phenylpropionate/trans-cinnamate dioxygenase ferredoxin component
VGGIILSVLITCSLNQTNVWIYLVSVLNKSAEVKQNPRPISAVERGTIKEKNLHSPQLHRVCHVSEIVEGTARSVEICDQRLALYNVSGTFYATNDRCTHARASLSEGFIEGDTIKCPLHGGRFHIPTGQPLSSPVSVAVCVYPVQVMDGEIYVQIVGNETEQER